MHCAHEGPTDACWTSQALHCRWCNHAEYNSVKGKKVDSCPIYLKFTFSESFGLNEYFLPCLDSLKRFSFDSWTHTDPTYVMGAKKNQNDVVVMPALLERKGKLEITCSPRTYPVFVSRLWRFTFHEDLARSFSFDSWTHTGRSTDVTGAKFPLSWCQIFWNERENHESRIFSCK